jgi:2-oxoglutarate ferredoxin oxidoreductase subunit gamma
MERVPEMRTEIRIAGFGGQGVALAGVILGKAMTIYCNFEAVMTQSYGPEARGGASSANLIISDEPIDYPFLSQPDILVALSQEAYTLYRPNARKDVRLIIDEDLVIPNNGDTPYCIPATRLAEELGRRVVTNVVMVGYFTAVTGLLTREAVEKSIEDTVRPKTLTLNLRAFDVGFNHPVIARPSGGRHE